MKNIILLSSGIQTQALSKLSHRLALHPEVNLWILLSIYLIDFIKLLQKRKKLSPLSNCETTALPTAPLFQDSLGPFSASFIVYFQSFQSNKHIKFYNNILEKCPSCIWRQDSNPQPLERESPSMTTNQGSRPSFCCFHLKK